MEERPGAAEPLVIGEWFTIDSRVLGEVRRVNVFVPTVYGEKIEAPMPVLYMPDGGLDEDFLHVAGLVQVLVSNGSMRPFVLVGIPNTQRRRDLTGPTSNLEDRKVAPVVGGSATFRRFIKEELMPAVKARYRTTDEAAIVGESLAGLFVVETLVVEPSLFQTYIAIDPSLWWNDGGILKDAAARAGRGGSGAKPTVFLTNSGEERVEGQASRLAAVLEARGDVVVKYMPLEGAKHATIYHQAALVAFGTVLAPGSK